MGPLRPDGVAAPVTLKSVSSTPEIPEIQVFRSENFPDLADEVTFPRLSESKLAWLFKQGGVRQTYEPGEILYEHAVREAPFFVIESGRV